MIVVPLKITIVNKRQGPTSLARGRRGGEGLWWPPMQVMEREQVVIIVVEDDQCSGLWRSMESWIAQGRRAFVFDMTRVTFLNSVNIAAIIAARNRAVAAGSRIAVAGLPDNIRAVFRILKLERLFDLNLDGEAAVAAVK